MIRLLIGGFLIAHGLVHIAVWATPQEGNAFDATHSWLLGSMRGLVAAAAIVVAIVLIAAGIALFAHAGLWRPLAVVGLAGSLALDVLYFNPWFIPIGIVNAGFLAALVWAAWPSVNSVGV